MDNKTLSIISYITIIGWIIAYFVGKDNADNLLKFHLKQSLGLSLVAISVSVIFSILYSVFPYALFPILGVLNSLISISILILAIIGIINASKAENKCLPVIGKYFEDQFSFIDNIQQRQ